MKKLFYCLLFCCAIAITSGCASNRIEETKPQLAAESKLPEGFVYLDSVIPNIVLDMRYCSKHNFVGDVIDGYEAPKCIITKKAADALKNVQEELNKYSMSLKIYDAYRPQRAVDHFVRWAETFSDTRMKREFYPDVPKGRLYKDGYIWAKSNHSKGSTVDLTIVLLPEKKELDMGSYFDFFGEISNTEYKNLKPYQKINRLLLKSIMEKYGFYNYEKEWWHYTLKNEPFPDAYFNFPVR